MRTPISLPELACVGQVQSRVAGVVGPERLATHLIPVLGSRPAHRSAYRDLADGLRALILDGQLLVGDPLPTQRALADALGLSRTTVVASLTMLRAEGYLSSRQGSGTTVRLPAVHPDRPDEARGGTGTAGSRPPDIDLSIAVLPAPSQVAAAAVRAAERLPEFLAGPGLHPFGLPELRAAVAARFDARGLATAPEQIMITQGALHSWDLVLRAFARPGGKVAVEQPSYPGAIDAVRAHRARVQPIGVSADGWQWPARGFSSVDIAYLVPDFQNPTGYFAPDAERRSLAERVRGALLCIDETFAELADPDGPVAAPTASYARAALTIGSLSKIMWAGVRVGWLRGPHDTITRVAAARSSQDIAAPVLDQLLALELMRDFDTIRNERTRLLRTRREHAVGLVRSAGWHVVEPAGGTFLWVDLQGASSTRLSAAARAVGVRVPPGTRFSTSGTHDRFLRVPFTASPAELAEAVQRLRRAATDDSRTDVAQPAIWTV